MRLNHSFIPARPIAAFLVTVAGFAHAQSTAGLPTYLTDRGEGIRTSLLGTYIRSNELVVYPFYEYTRTKNFEYKPSDLGYVGATDFDGGKLTEKEYLVYFGYGISDSLMVEFESALYSTVNFTKGGNDTSAVPAQIRESGLGDTEAQIRWRYAKETETRPDITFYFQTVFPFQRSKKLLGTHNWEFGTGTVVTKGYSFGTLSLRAGIKYDRGDRQFKVGEYGIDYLKRLSPEWRVALSLEGEESKLSAIGELQYTLSKNAIVKLNCGLGLTKSDRKIAPELGVLLSF